MKTFRELCDGKVWKAVQAMIDGLIEQDKREDFEIEMESFGNTDDKTCYGCAATCTMQKLTNRNLRSKDEFFWTEERAQCFMMDKEDLSKFEDDIDELRKTNVFDLFKYFDKKVVMPEKELECLETENWKKHLPLYQSYADQLKALDI